MRLALGKLKTFLYALLACLVLIGSFVFFRAANVSHLSAWKGERTFFLDSASSQALVKAKLSLLDIFRVKGESVQIPIGEFDGGRYANKENIDGQVRDKIARVIADTYGAYPVLKESVCGVDSYYFCANELPMGIDIDGKKVNLHVAVTDEFVTIGTPIIFGGF